ncbi:hypothetical protein GCM10027203_20150 [Nonomuraea fastidiosa]
MGNREREAPAVGNREGEAPAVGNREREAPAIENRKREARDRAPNIGIEHWEPENRGRSEWDGAGDLIAEQCQF